MIKLISSVILIASVLINIIELTAQNKNAAQEVWIPDNGTTYINPIIHADYSDPDAIRVGNNYFMTSSSFSHTPGLPILHSNDLINWKIINHVTLNLPYGNFTAPQHGNGIWAPSIRYHKGEYYIYYGDPDYGIFMSKTKNPFGRWQPLILVKKAKGWIDPCPFWDDDGNAYLVHAWAKSRSGVKSLLTLNKMSSDGKRVLDDGKLIFDGTVKQPTIEGPKIYKRNGYYYIFAPAGGVTNGWQTVLKAKNIYGPYEDKIVMEQGNSIVNGPHQGAWIETKSGESWFIHFQDKGAYGRIVHLQPMKWVNDFPVIGLEKTKQGCGEPVLSYVKPNIKVKRKVIAPQTSDEFNGSQLAPQWQWEANSSLKWYSLTRHKGYLRLNFVKTENDSVRLWDIPNVIGQKFPAEEFIATAKIHFNPSGVGNKTGLIILGFDYFALIVTKTESGNLLSILKCIDANKDGRENISDSVKTNCNDLFLRVAVTAGAICKFSYSFDGNNFLSIGNKYKAKKGMWVGAKVCIFASAGSNVKPEGYTDFDWFRFSK